MPPRTQAVRTTRSDRFEHNRKLDSSYSFDREGYDNLSVPAWVSLFKDDLAREFVPTLTVWDDKPEVRLIKWEEQRFGAQLEEVAHRILWHAVRAALVTTRG